MDEQGLIDAALLTRGFGRHRGGPAPMIAAIVPPEVKRAVLVLAEAKGITPSELVRESLWAYLAAHRGEVALGDRNGATP